MIHTIQKGFTLAEMLVVLAIFTILTSVTLFNYGQFRSETILTNMAYEVALSVREAQIYGVSARNVNDSGTPDFTIPYGVYLPVGSSGNYYLIADMNKDGVFDLADDQRITTYTMQNNIAITGLQYKEGGICNPEDSGLSFIFKRPNPEPIISTDTEGKVPNASNAIITISSSDGASRHVVVYNNGQVSVVGDLTGICN